MELDDLQKTWRNLTNATPTDNTLQLDTKSLRNMTQTRSKSVLDSLRANSLFELRINVICALLVFGAILLENNFVMRLVFGVFFLYEVLLGYYFYRKLHLLHHFASPDESLKDYLTNLHTQLHKFLRVYKYGNALLMPPAFLAGLFMGTYYNSNGFVGQWLAQSQDATFPFLVVGLLTLVGSLLGYALVSVWTKYLYGVHLKRLEEYTKELDAEG
ncbi:MAG: hypothetical protein EAZ95_15110 [Bacteroidetes bacterium]|nr:MAG: hypothetical protein EAZ95_15110 [Bacteroidota bacterium]